MNTTTLHLNGIDGETGKPLLPPLTLAEAAALARPAEGDPTAMKQRVDALTRHPAYGLPDDVTNPDDLTQAGWAIVFPEDTPPDVRAALEPLVEHRRTGIPPERFKILEYRKGDTYLTWVEGHGTTAGCVEPEKIPYYVLLVGGPTSIPFDFQYMLRLDYAVGRVAFASAAEYARYAKSVVDYERPSAAVPTRKQMVYWGPRHDPVTMLSADSLIEPLFTGRLEKKKKPIATERGFDQRCLVGDDATKAALSDVLHGRGDMRPAMLFTASHGVGFQRAKDRQLAEQGALRCQDVAEGLWSGPAAYFSAADIADDAQVHGLVAFIFACYGAGTPEYDDFMRDRTSEARRIAPAPFVAALPQRLLAHPGGGALAVIGHIERAWGYSIELPNVDEQIAPFQKVVSRILRGRPVGVATDDFRDRYSSMSTVLLGRGKTLAAEDLVARWIQRNDAQNYVLLGDPAVRLRPAEMR